MKRNKLVSIIVPVYNVEKYIGKCIESILSQDYDNFECILIDDGSLDNSGKICDEYAKRDKRITVIHKRNGGVSKARNCGLNRAKGDYICFVDGDDYVNANYVSYLYGLASSSDADISLTTKMFGNFSKETQEKNKEWIISGQEAVRSILCYKIPIGCYDKLFKKSVFENNKVRFFEDLKIGEGFNFNISCFLCSKKVACSNQKVYYYRRDNQASAMSSYSEGKADNQMYSIKKIKQQLDKAKMNCQNEFEYTRWRTESDLYDLATLCSAQDSKWYSIIKGRLKSGFRLSLKCNVSSRDRLRAFLFFVHPNIVPSIMKIRKKAFIR